MPSIFCRPQFFNNYSHSLSAEWLVQEPVAWNCGAHLWVVLLQDISLGLYFGAQSLLETRIVLTSAARRIKGRKPLAIALLEVPLVCVNGALMHPE